MRASRCGSFFLSSLSFCIATTLGGVARASDPPPIAQHPAYSGNYQSSSGRTIDMIVIHKAEGTAPATWEWFQDPSAQVSAHYVVDASGAVAQMVPDQDIAWHTGNSEYNHRSIGIENAGFTNINDISDIHLRGLAKITRYLCEKYGIPKDRSHVIGHNEVPDPNHPGEFGGRNHHTDPGPFFNWPLFMKYLNDDPGEATYVPGQPDPAAVPPMSEADAPSSSASDSSPSDAPSTGVPVSAAPASDTAQAPVPHPVTKPAPAASAKPTPVAAAMPGGDWLQDLLKEILALLQDLLARLDGDGLPLPVRPQLAASRAPAIAPPAAASAPAAAEPPRGGIVEALGHRD
jgi:hypothetical protein